MSWKQALLGQLALAAYIALVVVVVGLWGIPGYLAAHVLGYVALSYY